MSQEFLSQEEVDALLKGVTGEADEAPAEEEAGGVKNYDIEVWDTEAKSWKTVASEKQDRVMLNRVHILKQPALTSRFRVVVRAVAPIDGIARLLQVEAWGKP